VTAPIIREAAPTPTPPPAAAPPPKRGSRAAAAAAQAVQLVRHSVVAQTRRAHATPQLQAELAAIERDVVAGKAKRLRKALRRLPPELRSEPPRARPEEPSVEAVHRHHAPAPQARVHVPLPDDGEATIELERSRREGEAARVHVELDLAALGSVGIQLLADDAMVRCSIESDDPHVREFLNEALDGLSQALARAAGRPAAIGLTARTEETREQQRRAAPGIDAYA
jgi:hypothetical protein